MEKIVVFPTAASRESGFEALITPQVDYLFRLAYRFTGKKADAEDLVQDVLIKVYRQWQEVAGMERPRAWLARVTYNTYVDNCRRESRSPLAAGVPVADGDDDTAAVPLRSDADPAREVANGLTSEVLQQALGRLDPEQRALIALHDIEGYTLNELEGLLDCPLGTLKSRLHRTRAQLRKILQNLGTF